MRGIFNRICDDIFFVWEFSKVLSAGLARTAVNPNWINNRKIGENLAQKTSY